MGSSPILNAMLEIQPTQNIQKDDHQRFFVPDGKVDPNFSPQRNKAIIEQTIQEYEKLRAKKASSQDEHFGERADAVLSYLHSVAVDGGSDRNMEKYFGKRMLAYLRGTQIRDQLMANRAIQSKDGAIITR